MRPRNCIASWAVCRGRELDRLVGVRGAARFMMEEARAAGLAGGAAVFFDDPVAAGEFAEARRNRATLCFSRGRAG